MAKSKIADNDVLAYLQSRRQSLQEELDKVEAAIASLGMEIKPSGKKEKKKKKKLEKTVKAIRKKVAKAIDGVKSQAEALMETAASTDAGPAERTKPTRRRTPAVKAAAPSSEAAQAQAAPAEKPAAPTPSAAKAKRTSTSKKATADAQGTSAASQGKPKRGRAAAKTATDEPVSGTIPPVLENEGPTGRAKPKETTRSKRATAVKPSVAAADTQHEQAAPKAARRTNAKRIPKAAALNPSATMDDKIKHALEIKQNSTRDELVDYLHGLDPDYGMTKLRRVIAFRLNHLLKTGQIKGQESETGFRYTSA